MSEYKRGLITGICVTALIMAIAMIYHIIVIDEVTIF